MYSFGFLTEDFCAFNPMFVFSILCITLCWSFEVSCTYRLFMVEVSCTYRLFMDLMCYWTYYIFLFDCRLCLSTHAPFSCFAWFVYQPFFFSYADGVFAVSVWLGSVHSDTYFFTISFHFYLLVQILRSFKL
jgi:hypothetical protein